MEDGGKLLSLPVNSNPLTTAIMKKYYSPKIYLGIDAVYYLSVALEAWTKTLTPRNCEENKPQIFLAAKFMHQFCFEERFKGWK